MEFRRTTAPPVPWNPEIADCVTTYIPLIIAMMIIIGTSTMTVFIFFEIAMRIAHRLHILDVLPVEQVLVDELLKKVWERIRVLIDFF